MPKKPPLINSTCESHKKLSSRRARPNLNKLTNAAVICDAGHKIRIKLAASLERRGVFMGDWCRDTKPKDKRKGKPMNGKRLREVRYLGGWSQKEAASIVGVNVYTFRRWESDKARVPLSSFWMLAQMAAGDISTHPDWEGWFVDRHGVLHCGDAWAHTYTRGQLVDALYSASAATSIRVMGERLSQENRALQAENAELKKRLAEAEQLAAQATNAPGVVPLIKTRID